MHFNQITDAESAARSLCEALSKFTTDEQEQKLFNAVFILAEVRHAASTLTNNPTPEAAQAATARLMELFS
jgi:hypothetical protein